MTAEPVAETTLAKGGVSARGGGGLEKLQQEIWEDDKRL